MYTHSFCTRTHTEHEHACQCLFAGHLPQQLHFPSISTPVHNGNIHACFIHALCKHGFFMHGMHASTLTCMFASCMKYLHTISCMLHTCRMHTHVGSPSNGKTYPSPVFVDRPSLFHMSDSIFAFKNDWKYIHLPARSCHPLTAQPTSAPLPTQHTMGLLQRKSQAPRPSQHPPQHTSLASVSSMPHQTHCPEARFPV